MTRTTTARTIKRDTCKEAGKKGRKNNNNIGDEEEGNTREGNEARGGEKYKNKKTYNPQKEERQQEGKKDIIEETKRNDEGESEAEAPTKKNKHNQQEHRKIDQNHDNKKLKYLLHKKSSINKMIEKDLLSRREKARHIKQLSLSS